MLWGCRSEEVKDDSKLERRRWTEDRLLSFSGEGRNPWALLPFFFSSITLFLPSSFLPPPLPSLTPAVSPSLPPSLSETTSKWSPLANQPAAKICTTAFLFSLCLRACVIFQVFERVCPSWTFWVDPTQSNTHAHTPTLTAIKLQAEWFSRTPYTRLGGRKRCALVVVVCVSSASTNWQASHCSSCIFNVSDVLWYFCLARGSSARRYMEMQRLNSTVTV